MGWRTVLVVAGAAVCCAACQPAAAVPEPVRTTTASVVTLMPETTRTRAAADGVAWTDVCGPVPLLSAALRDGDAVVDLTACGAGGAPLAWRDGERAEATAALQVPGLPTESFAGVTCAGPMQSGVTFVALLATGRIIRVEVPVAGGSCPVAAPEMGTVIARLEERDPG
jgi:hypothetical protein